MDSLADKLAQINLDTENIGLNSFNNIDLYDDKWNTLIDRLIVNVSRNLIQGGLTNDEFGDNITDWRLQNHLPTTYVKKWKDFTDIKRDAKFTDLQNINNNKIKAEGKNVTDGVNLSPSRDVGSGRNFNQTNLLKCFEINDYYYLYDRENITEETIDIVIYWIPIKQIKLWYNKHGNKKGKITNINIKKCFAECKFNDTIWKMK